MCPGGSGAKKEGGGDAKQSKTMKTQETADAELIALAALANCEAVLMAGENQMRAHQGYAPAYRDGTGFGEWGEKLRDEMHRRAARALEEIK